MVSDSSDADEFLKTIDKSKFNIDSYSRRIEKPWGWEIHFVPDDMPYMGKYLHMDEGKRVSLQVHEQKQESWILLEGKVSILVETPEGEMKEIQLSKDKGYTVGLGQKHRLVGGQGGGTVIEVSTPEIGTTYRLEDDYNRPDETEERREFRNENLKDAG